MGKGKETKINELKSNLLNLLNSQPSPISENTQSNFHQLYQSKQLECNQKTLTAMIDGIIDKIYLDQTKIVLLENIITKYKQQPLEIQNSFVRAFVAAFHVAQAKYPTFSSSQILEEFNFQILTDMVNKGWIPVEYNTPYMSDTEFGKIKILIEKHSNKTFNVNLLSVNIQTPLNTFVSDQLLQLPLIDKAKYLRVVEGLAIGAISELPKGKLGKAFRQELPQKEYIIKSHPPVLDETIKAIVILARNFEKYHELTDNALIKAGQELAQNWKWHHHQSKMDLNAFTHQNLLDYQAKPISSGFFSRFIKLADNENYEYVDKTTEALIDDFILLTPMAEKQLKSLKHQTTEKPNAYDTVKHLRSSL